MYVAEQEHVCCRTRACMLQDQKCTHTNVVEKACLQLATQVSVDGANVQGKDINKVRNRFLGTEGSLIQLGESVHTQQPERV